MTLRLLSNRYFTLRTEMSRILLSSPLILRPISSLYTALCCTKSPRPDEMDDMLHDGSMLPDRHARQYEDERAQNLLKVVPRTCADVDCACISYLIHDATLL